MDQYLRVVRTLIDALGQSLEQALGSIPEEHREAVRIRYEEETALPIQRVNMLTGHGGPRAWFADWNPSEGYYWRSLRGHMVDRGDWTKPDVESLDDATDDILKNVEDPRASGPMQFRVRGLVMGYVQSGKTANFCALIAKAADLGYKLVIVLSGIHNSLRQQTQRRVDRALGARVDPAGVPFPEPGRRWISLTNDHINGDFSPGTVDANVLQGNEHVLAVVKKNATVLRRLIRWMGDHAPPALPVLIIDDEADQASINTRGNRPPVEEQTDLSAVDVESPDRADEIEPSVINGLIRSLVVSFQRVTYVAYTATPFANILINHLAYDREVYADLYPSDFIVALPRPNRYCGAERLFGRGVLAGEAEEVLGLDVIDLVPDHEATQLTPTGREVSRFVPRICPSLRLAIMDFVLAVAARQQRTGRDSAATMLVHTHHRMVVQNQMGLVIREHLSELRQSWRYDRSAVRPTFVDRWERRFRPVIAAVDATKDARFEEIEEYIDRLFRDPVPVLVLNSISEDELDYETDPSIKAIVVGGNRLSRGLTLEGLLVSYYVRRTEYYDTLMQMGRWFGFKEDYVDLTRICTTDELAGWFRYLALAEEELRRDIKRYERENLTPLDFGPKIRSHPAMMITARNKMGSAQIVSQNYSGRMLQTINFRLQDREWLTNNLNAAQRFLQALGNSTEELRGQPVWSGVPYQNIDEFLCAYRTDPRGNLELGAIRQFILEQARQDELVEWRVSMRGRGSAQAELGTEPAMAVNGIPANRITRTALKVTPHSIGSLVNPAIRTDPPWSGDEEIGLTLEQLMDARADAERSEDFPFELRRRRDRREGLLLLYPISPNSRPLRGESEHRKPLFENPERDGCTVVGMALVFPQSDSSATIEYVVGSVGTAAGEADE